MVDHKNLRFRCVSRDGLLDGLLGGAVGFSSVAMDHSLSNYEMLAMKPHEPCVFHAPVVSFRNWERHVWIDSIDDTYHETHRKRYIYICISY